METQIDRKCIDGGRQTDAKQRRAFVVLVGSGRDSECRCECRTVGERPWRTTALVLRDQGRLRDAICPRPMSPRGTVPRGPYSQSL